MRHFQGGVTDFSGFLTKDRTEQALLSRQFCLALRCDAADKNVTRTHFRTDADDTAVIQIFQRIFADARDIIGDLLGTELGVTRFCLIFFDMNRSVNIILNQTLTDQNGILVVVTFPCHETDERVLSECHLAAACGRSVSDHFTLLDLLAFGNDRALVVAVALVAAHELHQLILMQVAVLFTHCDMSSRHVLHNTVFLSQHADTGVFRCLLFHTGSDNRLFSDHQRHCLSLHVGTHQGAVRVVVLKERDQRCRD